MGLLFATCALQSGPPDIFSTYLTPHIVIKILLAIFPKLYFIFLSIFYWLCYYSFPNHRWPCVCHLWSMLSQMAVFCLFLWLSNISLYIYVNSRIIKLKINISPNQKSYFGRIVEVALGFFFSVHKWFSIWSSEIIWYLPSLGYGWDLTLLCLCSCELNSYQNVEEEPGFSNLVGNNPKVINKN